MNAADLWSLHAQQLLGLPGAVYAETYKSGPRKGKINSDRPTPGTERTVVVTRYALGTFAAQWEQTSGICSDCFGKKGREVWSPVEPQRGLFDWVKP